MTGSRTIMVSVLVLAGATCITCGALEDFMSSGIMKNNPFASGAKGGYDQISGAVSGDVSKSKQEAGYGDKQSSGVNESLEKFGISKTLVIEKEVGGKESGGKVSGYKENEVGKKHEGFLGCKTPADFFKLAMNPIELISRVVEHFGLDKAKFMEHMSKGISFGIEIALQPTLVSIKIIEKIFVPDGCRLRFVCKMASSMASSMSVSKGSLPKLSDKAFEGSAMVKAFSDGLQGCDCEAVYSDCKNGGPTLKPMFEKSGAQSSSAGSSGTFSSAINVSEMGGNILKSLQLTKGEQ